MNKNKSTEMKRSSKPENMDKKLLSQDVLNKLDKGKMKWYQRAVLPIICQSSLRLK